MRPTGVLSFTRSLQWLGGVGLKWWALVVVCRGVVSIAAFLLSLVAVTLAGRATAADDRAALAHFENEVRPLLVERCVKCHGRRKSENGLRLDTRAQALTGGDSGPAVVPGQPDNSLLLKAVRHIDGLEMPPDEQLEPGQIGVLEQWIKEGAVWPEGAGLDGSGPALRSGSITARERAFWSFQPLANPQPPDVAASLPVRNAIDQFVHAKLAAAGLAVRGPADRRTLLRRATFDLTGLPPTPAEMESFLNDDSPDAFGKVVDRLLASPSYGECWGRHWLDVVRYADTAGETADYPTPLAYKYRNWVIRAFNADMPYDEFVRQQIAGDLLAQEKLTQGSQISDEAVAEYGSLMTATGFIAISRRFGFDVENYHHLTIQDTIDVVGQSVLGLTLGCARCHDHKYDPVNMTDYYAWYGIFDSTRYSFPGSEEKKRPYDSFPALPPKIVAQRQSQFEARLAALDAEIKQAESNLNKSNDQPASDVVQQRLKDLSSQRGMLATAGPLSSDELIYGATERDQPADAKIQLRGEKDRLGDVAPRRNLEILGGDLVQPSTNSGRRQLAEWLTRRENALTPRVMVNRIWQHHFGRGLVASANDFGARGERPSHADLLDWLANRFIDSEWSVKAMHRLIMASAVYQQSSAYDAVAGQRDPDAKLLWRFNPRQLSAEEIRDSMLFVSGALDISMGGPHPFPSVDSWGFTQHAPFYGDYATNRRSVYLMQQRLKRHSFLALFDGADPNVSSGRRERTTTPTQALFLMNSEFVHQQAASFAGRLAQASAEQNARIEFAFQLALGRSATSVDCREAVEFLAAYRQALGADSASPEFLERAALEAYARTILARSEFLSVD